MNIENRLRLALADLLQIDAQQVCPNTNFDDLGLDSLLGMRFARAVGEAVNVETDLEWIFDYPTLNELSGFLEQRTRAAA